MVGKMCITVKLSDVEQARSLTSKRELAITGQERHSLISIAQNLVSLAMNEMTDYEHLKEP